MLIDIPKILNIYFFFIQVPLVEKSGRRPLILVGLTLMVIADVLITIALSVQHLVYWMSYISVVCLIIFIIGFAIGIGESTIPK